MIEIKDGQVYETVEIVTPTQKAIVTTHKCSQYKIKLSFENNLLVIRYMDWEDNFIVSNEECNLRISNYLTGQTQKIKLQLIDGVATYSFDTPDEYQISAQVNGTDGDSIFINLTE